MVEGSIPTVNFIPSVEDIFSENTLNVPLPLLPLVYDCIRYKPRIAYKSFLWLQRILLSHKLQFLCKSMHACSLCLHE